MALATFALVAASMVAFAAPAQAEQGWQAWGPWKTHFGSGKTFQCRNYVDATTVGSRLLLSASLECTSTTSAAVYLTSSPQGGITSKFCYQTSTCYISKYVNNPSGTQSWMVLNTSNIGGSDIPQARIDFRV
ncbi:hypothetical protein ABNF97_13855 [Plantactinospora sp. B6F1]|uniref:hypothetical protein n=1 Tax=Plantactinospora sp. B6F1 TaxID=3158971 RepID=UPI00102BDC28